jgi:chaperonin GroEL
MKQTNILIKEYEDFDAGYLGVCEAVCQTLGSEGKYALLDNGNDAPILTKDGVSAALKVSYENKAMNFGAMQAKQGAVATLNKVGDATTTTLTFQKSFLLNFKRNDFNKAVERGINLAKDEVTEHIKRLRNVSDEKVLRNIAVTSCNNDEELGETIIDAFKIMGFKEDAFIETSQNPHSEKVTVIEQIGSEIKGHGYASPFFINQDNKGVFMGSNVAVLCMATHQNEPALYTFLKENFPKLRDANMPLLIITERPILELKEKLIMFRKVNYDVCMVNLSEGSDFEAEILLTDIATLTGGEMFHPESNPKFVLGTADKVVVSGESTLISVKEVPSALEAIAVSLREKTKKTKSDNERLARLTGKSCIIEVGGLTPNDIKEKYDRVDDALNSVKSAIKEGYISGGGSALVYISNLLTTKLKNSDEQKGYNLVKKVIQEPFQQILKNANRTDFESRDWFRKSKLYSDYAREVYGVGYNTRLDKVSNLIEDGVIDSAMSIRVALESATESAVKMLNTGVIIMYPKI